MDQKNTIVKCTANPNCLFNHNGICDNYVINIGANGKCENYFETDNTYAPPSAQEILEYTIKLEQEKLMRGQRTKGNLFDDACDNKETVIAAIQDELLRQQMCWYCDNGSHGNCKLTAKPFLDRNGKCPRYTSTGAIDEV